MVCQLEHRLWKVHVDGASRAKGARAGIVIITLEGILLEHSFRLGFNTSNNEAEYEALLFRIEGSLKVGSLGRGNLFGFTADS